VLDGEVLSAAVHATRPEIAIVLTDGDRARAFIASTDASSRVLREVPADPVPSVLATGADGYVNVSSYRIAWLDSDLRTLSSMDLMLPDIGVWQSSSRSIELMPYVVEPEPSPLWVVPTSSGEIEERAIAGPPFFGGASIAHDATGALFTSYWARSGTVTAGAGRVLRVSDEMFVDLDHGGFAIPDHARGGALVVELWEVAPRMRIYRVPPDGPMQLETAVDLPLMPPIPIRAFAVAEAEILFPLSDGSIGDVPFSGSRFYVFGPVSARLLDVVRVVLRPASSVGGVIYIAHDSIGGTLFHRSLTCNR
jgi:hypothetical protein